VSAERELLEPLRAAADAVIDSSDIDAAELARRVVDTVRPGTGEAAFVCTVSSFGFKYGLVLDADWVVDSRFLRNPFWEPQLRMLTGFDGAVRDYVLDQPNARELVDRLVSLLAWAAERAGDHGRRRLHVAVGCTGGRHRSVVLADEIAARLRSAGVDVAVHHRDVDRPVPASEPATDSGSSLSP
jgi:UPF0042 nucleotide-binding protein